MLRYGSLLSVRAEKKINIWYATVHSKFRLNGAGFF
jgi:hypothetical protein